MLFFLDLIITYSGEFMHGGNNMNYLGYLGNKHNFTLLYTFKGDWGGKKYFSSYNVILESVTMLF